jgi:putative serine protease PepD
MSTIEPTSVQPETGEQVESVEPNNAQVPWWSTPSSGVNSSGSSPYAAPAQAAAPESKPSGARIGIGLAVVMALVAGLVGALLGRNLAVFGGSANLVSVKSVVERAPNSIAGIAARVSPSVVSISVNSQNGSDTGSGFFIQKNGYILTNNHVVENAVLYGGTITVNLANEKSYPAKVIGRDTSYDLAVLKINVTDAPALSLGNSDDIQVGDTVIAIGSPLGLAGTVTSGIISAKNRAVTAGSGTGESSFINALQTDAAINPGNSGGPLVDASGAVIGVNSAIASLGSGFGSQSGSIGLGFAIPINQARKTAEQLINTGHSTYPIMGISLDNSYSGVGAKIADISTAILSGGPAAKAGLQPGDVIIGFAGNTISTPDELIVAIRSHSVGDKVTVKFQRGGSTKEVSLTLVAQK